MGRAQSLLILGLAGGLFTWAQLPLSWMLGPAFAGLVMACWGKPVISDGIVGDLGRAVLGAAIGGGLTVASLSLLVSSIWLLPGIAIYVCVAGLVGAWWLSRLCGWDRRSAWFAALPGGLSRWSS